MEAPAPVESGAGEVVVAEAGSATAGAATSPAVSTPASKDFLDCSDMYFPRDSPERCEPAGDGDGPALVDFH
ncbi:hypothetical protein GCM10009670_12410 [Citricoccus alkalitolerans]